MATTKQIAANRANALASTGPRTIEGKAAASRNALKHGLTAEAVVVAWENAEDFEAFRSGLFESLKPQGQLEAVLADRVACGAWRLRRAIEIEAAAFVEEERNRREFDAMFPKDRNERCMIGFCADHLAV